MTKKKINRDRTRVRVGKTREKKGPLKNDTARKYPRNRRNCRRSG